MSQSMEISAAGIDALAKQYRAVAMNLSNISTPGYKRRIGSFQQALDNASLTGNSEIDKGFEQVDNKMFSDFSQGILTSTGRKLDVAIQGDALFVVETENGPLYTRNGTFTRNQNGKLVDSIGRTISGDNGPIMVPADTSTNDLTIGSDGTVQAGENVIGKIKTVFFSDTKQLRPVGNGCFMPPKDMEPQNTKTGDYSIHQTFRESANVNSASELINLMRITRLYETNINSLRKVDEQVKSLINIAMS